MLTREDNELLCRVEGERPMGQLMRRHWLPVCLSEEVAERDGAPVRARLLGEDLVVFRDTKGRLGVLGEHCLHRARVARLRPQRGMRPALPLPRLEVRRGRQRRRHAVGAAGRRRSASARRPTPIRRARAAASSGSGWARQEEMREFEPPAWAPQPGIAHRDREDARRVQLGAGARGLDRLGAQLEPALDQHAGGARSTGSTATGTAWLRPSNDKAPRLQFEPTQLRLPLRRDPQADPEPRDRTSTSAPRCSSRRSPC